MKIRFYALDIELYGESCIHTATVVKQGNGYLLVALITIIPFPWLCPR